MPDSFWISFHVSRTYRKRGALRTQDTDAIFQVNWIVFRICLCCRSTQSAAGCFFCHSTKCISVRIEYVRRLSPMRFPGTRSECLFRYCCIFTSHYFVLSARKYVYWNENKTSYFIYGRFAGHWRKRWMFIKTGPKCPFRSILETKTIFDAENWKSK